MYEFEDLLYDIDNTDIISPFPRSLQSDFINRNFRRIKTKLFGASHKKYLNQVDVEQGYDLFMASCLFITDLLELACIKNWKKCATIKICWLVELWEPQLEDHAELVEILSEFDFIILNTYASVEPLKKAIAKPVYYYPPAIDTIQFCPYPNSPDRCIDIYYMGRRSDTVHKALLEMSEKEGKFYLFDTFENMNVQDIHQHRHLMANIIKRSFFFIVNEAKFNCQAEIRGKSEIGLRYIEGTAGGAVLLGAIPKNDVFKKHFFWPDAVISMASDDPDIDERLLSLTCDHERIDRARRNNLTNCLALHDWSHRWENILDMAGLKPSINLSKRQKCLEKLSQLVNENTGIN